MQVKKKYETYDINKDQKFLYARELLNFKEKRGIDVLELMQKIDKKQILYVILACILYVYRSLDQGLGHSLLAYVYPIYYKTDPLSLYICRSLDQG